VGDSYGGLAPIRRARCRCSTWRATRGARDACMRAGDLKLAGTDGTGIPNTSKATEVLHDRVQLLLRLGLHDGRRPLRRRPRHRQADPTTGGGVLRASPATVLVRRHHRLDRHDGCKKVIEMKRTRTGIAKDVPAPPPCRFGVRNWGTVDDCLLADKLLGEAPPTSTPRTT